MSDDSLQVPDATLFYRVHGGGPALLILPGGDGDADTVDALRQQLDDRYTVVTYDRRGLSRSEVESDADDLSIATHSDDAHRLLAALTDAPALVFGSSIGALIGLDLVARHPEQVAILVAHEPPAWDLLPDAERDRAARVQENMEDAFRRDGPDAAFRLFGGLATIDYDDREPDIRPAAPTPMHAANHAFFFTHDSPAVRHYEIDIAALAAAPTRVVVACGTSTPDSMPCRAASVLAARLGGKPAPFPGGHIGWLLRPKGFAARLRETLG